MSTKKFVTFVFHLKRKRHADTQNSLQETIPPRSYGVTFNRHKSSSRAQLVKRHDSALKIQREQNLVNPTRDIGGIIQAAPGECMALYINKNHLLASRTLNRPENNELVEA
ncbi:hypothetical protein [Pelagicoccus sp. SDUM812002]|uniref:hypothetical protein n=1 Tax=Pelagicoccus sp. SDUM812002 TaxID=3041266 RepID=UPI00280E6A68|nr:hypothetical protein [Pelagicoccus sp. SDUM812002]MDQ8185928.1 hypothetical protein [Pelagicoccus sp. SDUM812002]